MSSTTSRSVPAQLRDSAGLLAIKTRRWIETPLTWARPYFFRRRLQGYCVGAPKSGTHSLAGIFKNYRAAHEPENDLVIDWVLKYGRRLSVAEQATFLRAHDRRVWLEFESSHLLVDLIEGLVAEFPQAKFVLPIRNCYSWLESILNRPPGRYVPGRWRAFARFQRQQVKIDYAPQSQILQTLGLPPLEKQLARWAAHHQRVLAAVPSERLLILKTPELAQCGPRLATFFNIPESTLVMSRSHLYKAPSKNDVLSQIEPHYLKDKVDEYCGELMREFFPEVNTLADSRRLAEA